MGFIPDTASQSATFGRAYSTLPFVFVQGANDGASGRSTVVSVTTSGFVVDSVQGNGDKCSIWFVAFGITTN
jgi:hypothetical protein